MSLYLSKEVSTVHNLKTKKMINKMRDIQILGRNLSLKSIGQAYLSYENTVVQKKQVSYVTKKDAELQ